MLSKSELYNSDTHHKSKVKASFHKAFTLAETLLALVIIGVIAALTIPQIINKYNRTIMATHLEHTYSVLANMLKRAELDNGSIGSWDLGEFAVQGPSDSTWNRTSGFVEKYMLPYIIHTKYQQATLGDFGYKNGFLFPNKTVYYSAAAPMYGLFLQNGVCLFIYPVVRSLNNGNNVIQELYFFADLNGLKGPNIIGKDIFVFEQPFVDGHPLTTFGEYNYIYCYYWGFTESEARTYALDNGCTYMVNKDTGYIMFFPEAARQSQETTISNCKRGDSYSLQCGTAIKNNSWEVPDDYPWL